MRHKTLALVTMALCLALAVAALILGVQTRGSAGLEEAEATAAPGAAVTPEAISTRSPTEESWAGPYVPDQGAEVSSEYFADAAFLGNSVMSGLDMYDYDMVLHQPDESGNWVSIPDFYWSNSLTVLDISGQIAKMEENQYGKVYVGLGTNEMSYDLDTLRQAFSNLIGRLEENNPGCIIYLMSVPPVSAYKSSTDRSYSREYVQQVNQMLQELAADREVWYLDVYSVLCDDEGYLPSAVTSDGVHFNGDHYTLWFDYLQTHYVPDGTPVKEAPAEDGEQ